MGNCVRRLTGGELEKKITSTTGPSATPDVTSNFHTDLEQCKLSALDEVALEDCSGAGSSMEPKSEYFSERVEEMMRSKSQFSSTVEHEIEHAKVHWTKVRSPSDSSEDNDDYEEMNQEYYDEVNRENVEVFLELMVDPQWKHHDLGPFFGVLLPDMKLGQKIAEGGQAEIFELMDIHGTIDPKLLLKVFKRGSRLIDLRKQWPCGILRQEVELCIARFGCMLDDGRFVFGMLKCRGDLCKFIDQAMQEKNNQGPPFPYEWSGHTLDVREIMVQIAYQMHRLHEVGIIHRDLKAANILLHVIEKDLFFNVADFECSIGVVGTGFWRAPKILLALKNRGAIDFSKKMDVYSYAMLCFEVVTGRLPFEGELEACRASDDLVIEGRRPKLPKDLDVTLKDLIERCWNPIPKERPNFLEIILILHP